MIKIGRVFRNTVIEGLKKDIEKAESLFVVQYSGLSSVQMSLLRLSLRASRSKILVTKNSLIRRAFKDSRIEGLDILIEGCSALVFGPQDIAGTSRALTKFAKENQNLIVRGALFNKRLLNKKDIENISALPSQAVLRGEVVRALKTPLSGLVFVLKGNINKLVFIINQIREKKLLTAKEAG